MQILNKLIGALAERFATSAWNSLRPQLLVAHANYVRTFRPRMPQTLIDILVLGEDRRFSSHRGVDLIALLRATWQLISKRKVTGGSTIEQQLVRTFTRQCERRISRKVREILLASLVQKAVSKADIPGVYLSVAYFGWQMNGIEQACKRLHLDLSLLTPAECAWLVARLKYPEPEFASAQRKRQIARRVDYLLNSYRNRPVFSRVVDLHVSPNAKLFNT